MREIAIIILLTSVVWFLFWLDKKIKKHAKNYTSDQAEAKEIVGSSSLNDITLDFQGQIPSNTRGFDGMCFLYSGGQSGEFIEVVLAASNLEEVKAVPDKIAVNTPRFRSDKVKIKKYLVNGKVVCDSVCFGD